LHFQVESSDFDRQSGGHLSTVFPNSKSKIKNQKYSMDLGLKGKVALVAAASRGLGRAVAEELATEGASLVLCARGAEALEETRAYIEETKGAPVVAVRADVSIAEDVAKVFTAGFERFGQIDILVTNAGGPPAGQFETLSREAWEAATRLTLHSALELTRQVLPGMKERRWGRILNITSIAVKQPVENLLLSNSLRAAVTGFARTLANEVATWGITVNNIMPGYTRTERLEELAGMMAKKDQITEAEFMGRWEKEIPMGRLGDPREFAALAAFLVSERASYITGTSIPVDGGWIRALL
jgi:3-oxoacyl-[acyl-carrier protein] reductase